MAIDYEAKRLPMGDGEWASLLRAIEMSQPSDETDWVEHKAGLDPLTKAGGAALAKGIVAFANRHLSRRAVLLGGARPIVESESVWSPRSDWLGPPPPELARRTFQWQ